MRAIRGWVREWVTLPRRWRQYRDELRQHNAMRSEFNNCAVELGYAGRDYLESAVDIAWRCRRAEGELENARCETAAADRRAEDLIGVLAPGGAMVMAPAQAERLAWLIEECGEVQRAAAKVLRGGYDGSAVGGKKTCRIALEQELGDLRAATELLLAAGDLRRGEMRVWQNRAAQGIAEKMRFQPRADAERRNATQRSEG